MHIYGLEDPRDNSIFYVGMTADLYARFIQHIRCEGDNQLKNERISELKAAGLLPIPRTLEIVHATSLARAREQYWISHYLYLGMPLTNEIRPAMLRKIKQTMGTRVLLALENKSIVAMDAEEKEVTRQLEPLDWQCEQVLVLLKNRRGQNEIVETIWGVKSKDGRPYRAAVEEYRAILAVLAQRIGA